ncbi:Uncharacterised protein [Vibrio cholerae]|nr:Uncharacterised protein [Vibrio cholerae]
MNLSVNKMLMLMQQRDRHCWPTWSGCRCYCRWNRSVFGQRITWLWQPNHHKT